MASEERGVIRPAGDDPRAPKLSDVPKLKPLGLGVEFPIKIGEQFESLPAPKTYEDGLAEGKRLAVDIRNALAGLLLEWDWGRIFSATGQRDDNAMKAMKAIARAREALGNYDLAAATMNVPLEEK